MAHNPLERNYRLLNEKRMVFKAGRVWRSTAERNAIIESNFDDFSQDRVRIGHLIEVEKINIRLFQP